MCLITFLHVSERFGYKKDEEKPKIDAFLGTRKSFPLSLPDWHKNAGKHPTKGGVGCLEKEKFEGQF